MKRSHLFAWFASTIIITASAFAAGNSKFAEKNDINTKTYQAAKDAVAIIEGKQGSGTGFICEMDGQKYLVTNRHVADQRGMIVALFQDGSKITFTQDSSIEMAINRDLVRFKVDTEKKGVQIANDSSDIGDHVEFYGNAGGGGVITVTVGKILAMGPENIEIDAQIQAGNSGSPLIRVSDGKVIGVTTVSWFNKIDGDLSKVGTRYDPNIKLTREFAVRFLNVEWKQMTYGQFIKWINAREDLIYFVGELIEKICFRGKSFVFENDLPDITLKGLPALNEQLQLIAKCDENLRKSIEHYNDMVLHNKNEKGATIARYGNTEFEFAKKMISAKTVDSYKVRQQVIKNVMNIVNVSKLLSIDEKTIFMKYLDKQLRDYNEQNKLQLKGKNLPDFQLEEKETQY